jgi:hypothetical protein
MPAVYLNNVNVSGNEEEAIRDGYYLRKPDGTLEITQKLPAAILRETANLERLSSMAKDALAKGATVELGPNDIGEFVQKSYAGDREKARAFADALRKAGLDPDAIWAEAKAGFPAKESAPRLRAWEINLQTKKSGEVVDANEPDGRRVTPAPPAAADTPTKMDRQKGEAA